MDGDEKTTPECIKPSILRLRSLREKLCTKQSDWKAAFEIRDYVLSELQLLHQMLLDNSVARDACIEKTECILSTFDDQKQQLDSEK